MIKIVLMIILYFAMETILTIVFGLCIGADTLWQLEKGNITYDMHVWKLVWDTTMQSVVKSFNPIGRFGDLIWPIILIRLYINFNKIRDDIVLKVILKKGQG